MFIQRDYSRTEHDDYVLRIQPRLGNLYESLAVYKDGVLIGWELKPKYE